MIMKKYYNPEFEIVVLACEDILTLSETALFTGFDGWNWDDPEADI